MIPHKKEAVKLLFCGADETRKLRNAIIVLTFPPASVIDAWREDYEYMLLHMIYDTDAPSFEKLIDVISHLQSTIKALPYKPE